MSLDKGHGHAYDTLGIDPQKGCIIIVRPDQRKFCRQAMRRTDTDCWVDVSAILALDEYQQCDAFLEGVLIPEPEKILVPEHKIEGVSIPKNEGALIKEEAAGPAEGPIFKLEKED